MNLLLLALQNPPPSDNACWTLSSFNLYHRSWRHSWVSFWKETAQESFKSVRVHVQRSRVANTHIPSEMTLGLRPFLGPAGWFYSHCFRDDVGPLPLSKTLHAALGIKSVTRASLLRDMRLANLHHAWSSDIGIRRPIPSVIAIVGLECLHMILKPHWKGKGQGLRGTWVTWCCFWSTMEIHNWVAMVQSDLQAKVRYRSASGDAQSHTICYWIWFLRRLPFC